MTPAAPIGVGASASMGAPVAPVAGAPIAMGAAAGGVQLLSPVERLQ